MPHAEKPYLSETDCIAECRPRLLLGWRIGRPDQPGMVGYIDLGTVLWQQRHTTAIAGVMDDFGTFVCTDVTP